ncbi:hypothetical protein [Litoribacillus peritrichatus]|uniref:C2H2-type domain-containing protein n=1 Tax=Litoribacillus peritrichatus TaxID=718191 RepID=A0ABP7MB94_9GAMM
MVDDGFYTSFSEKMKLDEIDIENLKWILEKESSTLSCKYCVKQNLLSWSNITGETQRNINVIAEFDKAEEYIKKNGYTEYHPEGTNYWSSDAPVAVQFYPYHESKINVCSKCGAVFLTYTEYSGHGPQHRIRYIKKNLIVS